MKQWRGSEDTAASGRVPIGQRAGAQVEGAVARPRWVLPPAPASILSWLSKENVMHTGGLL